MNMSKSNLQEVLSELKVHLKSLTFRDPFIDAVPKMSTKKYQKYDRFLVNIYNTKPPSSRSMNRSTLTNLFDQSEKNKPKVDKSRKNNSPRKMTEFLLLRGRRDVECLKMKEASKIISHLSKHPGFWTEKLVAEKVLLESGRRVEMLKRRISEDYVSVGSKDVRVGSLTLSNFKFNVKTSRIKRSETLYFVLVLTNDDEVKASSIQRGTGEIAFNEHFTFPITLNFKIKVQVYCYRMKDSKFVLPWKTPRKFSTMKLQYKNLNTSKFEETSILKTSFQLWGEVEVVASNVHQKAWSFRMSETSTLENFAMFSVETANFKIENKRRGFATMGVGVKDTFLWDRRWCSLNGHSMMVFSSPNDEDLVSPLITLDLSQCLGDKIEEAPREVCSRRRSILIETPQEKYFFMFDTTEELRSWLRDINFVLEALRFKNCNNL